MSFLYENLAVVYIAVSTAIITWMFAGTHAELLVPVVPWLCLFMAEVILVFPQRHEGESIYFARERVWEAIVRDPLVWVSIAFMALMTIPFFNTALCPWCDAKALAAGASPKPAFPYLPYCVDTDDHLNVFLWFAAALSTTIGVRHGLCGRGKRLLLKLLVWNGFAAAVFGFAQCGLEAPGPLWWVPEGKTRLAEFFSVFGYPNFAGDYFCVMFALACALWRRGRIEEDRRDEDAKNGIAGENHRGRFWRKNLYLVPALVFFVAAVNTLSRAAIIIVSVLALFMFIHAFLTFSRKLKRAARVRRSVISFLSACLVVFFCTILLPEDIRREVDRINTTAVLDRVSGKSEFHSRVAFSLLKEHPAFGIGGWGYRHYCRTKMSKKEIALAPVIGGANVHNDYLQFAVEHGIVGCALIIAIVGLLLLPVIRGWKRLYLDARFMREQDKPAKPVLIFSLPPPAFCILAACLATTAHTFGDCPLRCPAILILHLISLAVIPGFLPRESQKPVENTNHHHHH